MNTKIYKICFYALVTFCLNNISYASPVKYVSDDLTIPMRTGTTTNHKILKFLNSGTAVEIKEVTDDGQHAWVMVADDNNKVGWVETRLLMDEPSAREQLASLDKKHASRLEQNKELRKEIDGLKKTNKDLETELNQVTAELNQTSQTLANLRESAARPIEIAELNQKLEEEIETQKKENEKLIEENAFLSDQNVKEWFLIGGGVSIGSLILGLLITRISWKKRESWGGNF